jgi:hypothetical protein
MWIVDKNNTPTPYPYRACFEKEKGITREQFFFDRTGLRVFFWRESGFVLGICNLLQPAIRPMSWLVWASLHLGGLAAAPKARKR